MKTQTRRAKLFFTTLMVMLVAAFAVLPVGATPDPNAELVAVGLSGAGAGSVSMSVVWMGVAFVALAVFSVLAAQRMSRQ